MWKGWEAQRQQCILDTNDSRRIDLYLRTHTGVIFRLCVHHLTIYVKSETEMRILISKIAMPLFSHRDLKYTKVKKFFA